MELISAKAFKRYSPVRENTDVSEFANYVVIAQKLHTDEILGDKLRIELETQISAQVDDPDGNHITPHNKALLEMLAPVIAFYAVYQGLPFHWASLVNKGVTIRESENSKGVDVNDVAQLRVWILEDARVFREQLIEYLCKCAKNYPLWGGSSQCAGASACGGTSQNVNDLGIYFGK